MSEDAKDYAALADLREMLGVGGKPMLSEMAVLVRDEIQSLQAKLKAATPCLTADMPEDWKDGRKLLVLGNKGTIWATATWDAEGQYFGIADEYASWERDISEISHVMLPPTIGGGDEG